MTTRANAAPGRAAQAAVVRAQDHPHRTPARVSQYSGPVCPACGTRRWPISFGPFGDSGARCAESTCGFRGQRRDFRRAEGRAA